MRSPARRLPEEPAAHPARQGQAAAVPTSSAAADSRQAAAAMVQHARVAACTRACSAHWWVVAAAARRAAMLPFWRVHHSPSWQLALEADLIAALEDFEERVGSKLLPGDALVGGEPRAQRPREQAA